jgi:hypothetical protein
MGSMALVTCPDCITSVSDAAAACPKCGRPMRAAPTSPDSAPVVTTPDVWHDRNYGCLGGAVLILIVALVLFAKCVQ